MFLRKLLFVSFVLASSCASWNPYDYEPQDGYSSSSVTEPDLVEYIDSDQFEAQITFLGMGSQYFIFEASVENHSGDTVYLSHTDFAMDVLSGVVKNAYDPSELVDYLRTEKKQWKKEKKTRTIWNSIVTGLGIVAAAASGSPAAENLLFSAEPIAYIFADRSFYQRNIDSVDDEIDYVLEMGMQNDMVAPGSILVRDLLFPIQIITSDVRLVYTRDRSEYDCFFEEDLFRTRR